MFDFEKGKIRFIRGGRYPQSNSLLIDDDIRAIIDPACDEKKLLSIHKQQPLDVIINSHGHEDHVLYNSRFPEAQLWVHELAAGFLKNMDGYLYVFQSPEEVDEKTKIAWSKLLSEVVKYRPREADRLLEDKEILDFGQTRVQVLHTPGHSPGHLAFHFLEEKVLFLADLDLVESGPYYGDSGSSIENTIKSLQHLAKIDADVYLVSHGKKGIIDGDPTHIQRYMQVIYHREDRLLNVLVSGPKTIPEIAAHGIIYDRRRLSDKTWDLGMSEKAMIQKHLERLEKMGRVIIEDGKYHLSYGNQK
jgi:glyoxylase-like metal-dependent hydrolase (beta-lactamase superfamily II)